MKFFALIEKGQRHEYVEHNGKVFRTPGSNLEALLKIASGSKLDFKDQVDIDITSIMNGKFEKHQIDLPILPQEVWGSGISYFVSRERYSESDAARIGGKTIYETVYDAERPEIFFKATLSRCSAPSGDIAIRSDSDWTLPEPELSVAIDSSGRVLGYMVFDDVSARDIETENPLYLPESKIYDRCCSFGPVVVTPDEVGDPYKLEISMIIYRGGNVLFNGSTNTELMKTKIDTQLNYLLRNNNVPDGTILTTGTCILPGKEHSLRNGDRVDIAISKLGTLSTGVVKLD